MGSKCCKSNPEVGQTDLTEKIVDRNHPKEHTVCEGAPKLTDA